MGTIATFYDLETEKLIADGKKVALFTNHPGTLGAFREARLRQYLIDHVPGGYKVSSGFVSHADRTSHDISDKASKQIDCLVYECSNEAALLETADFACVEAVRAAAIVEIKSDLKITRSYAPRRAGPSTDYPFTRRGRGYRWAGTLVDAFENIKSAIDVIDLAFKDRNDPGKERWDYHASIFAYNGDELNLLEEAFTSGELIRQLGISTLDQLPDSICVLTRGWWSFEAYEDRDPPWDATYDDQKSWLNRTTGRNLAGLPLQNFTSYFAGNLQDQTGATHKTGGLRSSLGRKWSPICKQFDLASPRRGQ